MVECWAFEAKMRPTMADVYRRLGEMLRHPASLARISHAKHQSPSNERNKYGYMRVFCFCNLNVGKQP